MTISAAWTLSRVFDAIGLPLAADTTFLTLAAGFEVEIIQSAATQIADAFSGLF
jgi:hypothetical protein